ncbi:MAG TPA: glycosyltransferase [Gemmatimonadaceae bacterium]|nr:glycosyltransferase [Gemmatimonadaceae bacterium]
MIAPARRARLLHVVLTLDVGGLERLVIELVNRADAARFDSHVLTIRHAGRRASDLRDPDVLHAAPPQSRWSMLWPRELAAEIRTLAPDIVHTHSGVWYKASLAAALAGVRRSVHTDHGRLVPDRWHDRLTDGLAARRTGAVVAVSDPLAAYMRRALHVPTSRLRVIRNGVDVDAFAVHGAARAASVVRSELGIAPDVPVIGSIGRLDAIKDYALLIEAFAVLRAGWRGGPAPALVIAGDGPERASLESRVRALDARVAADVRFLGFRSDVRELLAAFDVFSLSSRSEGTSLSLLEAMSAGLCPVVSNVGGNADVLGPELAHRLVDSREPRVFGDALTDALRAAERRRTDGDRARRRARSEYSLDAMVRAYERLYSALLVT